MSSPGVKTNFFVGEVAKAARYAVPSVGYLTKMISSDADSEQESYEETNLKSAVSKLGKSAIANTKGIGKKAIGLFAGMRKVAEGAVHKAVNKDSILQTLGKFRNMVSPDYMPPGT